MAIRIYNDKIRFVADSDGDTDIDLLIESDGLRFTGTLTTAYNVPYGSAPPVLPQPPPAQGTVAGFTSGGYGVSVRANRIDKFPFSITTGFATDLGDLSEVKSGVAGQSSRIDGFASGGQPQSPPYSIYLSTIDKFPFSITTGTATDVGDLSTPKINPSGQSSSTDGFSSGGYGSSFLSTIDKFPFSITTGTATDVGDLSQARPAAAGQSSSTDGFASGGFAPPYVSTIDKFPFTISSGTATDVGDLSTARQGGAGQSSSTDGFTAGGGSPHVNTIDKFPFSITTGTATDVGDLTFVRSFSAGQSSTTDGFASGGETPTRQSRIDKFPFTISGGTSTDVGDLIQARSLAASHQD